MSRGPLTPEDSAFAEFLCKKYYTIIRRVAKARLGSDTSIDINDVIQDVFEMICDQTADFRKSETPGALVWTITSRHVDKLLNKEPKHEPLKESIPAPETDGLGIREYFTEDMTDFDKFLLEQVYIKKETIADIARDIGVPAPRLRQRLKRLRDDLKIIIEEDE